MGARASPPFVRISETVGLTPPMTRTTYMGRVLPTLKSRREMSLVGGGTAPTADPARARPCPALSCSLPRALSTTTPQPPQPAFNGTGALALVAGTPLLGASRPKDAAKSPFELGK